MEGPLRPWRRGERRSSRSTSQPWYQSGSLSCEGWWPGSDETNMVGRTSNVKLTARRTSRNQVKGLRSRLRARSWVRVATRLNQARSAREQAPAQA